MTAELQWRRRWKPDLKACAWKKIDAEVENDAGSSRRFLAKTEFDESSYEILITDMNQFWYEKLGGTALQKRISKLNPRIEAPLRKLLDQIQSNIENPGKETLLCLKEDNDSIVLEISSQLAGMPFCFLFQASPATQNVGRDHLTIPLMVMVSELFRQQQELFTSLAAKDKQIEDYKSQGAKVSRKNLETTPFDEIAFRNNMTTSKGFEAEVKSYGEKTFTSLGQDLYREITTKWAWLQSSPAKDSAVDMGEPLECMSGDSSRPSVESWSNRFPASLAQRNSSPNKPTTSPEKHPATSPLPAKVSSPETAIAKDTELLRRQALERKLEEEEKKQQEKVKKKKKLKF